MFLTGIRLEELPDKSVILVEEEVGDVKRIFSQVLANDALRSGKSAIYITSRLKDDILMQMSVYELEDLNKLEIVEKFNDVSKLLDLCKYDLCIIENFTLPLIYISQPEVLNLLNSLVACSRNNNSIIVLTSEPGIVSEGYQRLIRSMVDGIIQLTVKYTESRIDYYINVPKMRGSPPPTKLMPFSVDDEGRYISIDNRERFA